MTARRLIRAFLVVGDPDTTHVLECPRCGFDSLLAFPIYALSDFGVSTWGVTIACGRTCQQSGDA